MNKSELIGLGLVNLSGNILPTYKRGYCAFCANLVVRDGRVCSELVGTVERLATELSPRKEIYLSTSGGMSTSGGRECI